MVCTLTQQLLEFVELDLKKSIQFFYFFYFNSLQLAFNTFCREVDFICNTFRFTSK